ncbi:MAG: hypothetical protein KGJ90_07475 [Patescibacteria group bacterium]|nr:hypothetical protein [Nitrososphaerota archaeon]MDE2233912.1 hypothetical protein [Patescibacteria group bacterium]
MGNQRQAAEVELAIMAGFFAGEGSVSLKKQYGGGRVKCPALYVSMGNTEKFWIESFQKQFGGSCYVEIPKNPKAKPVWRWRLHNAPARDFLIAIFPFLLGEKRQQAEIAIEFMKVKDARIANWKWHTPEQLTAMERFADQMAELRRAVAETKRAIVTPLRSDSPTLPAMAANS